MGTRSGIARSWRRTAFLLLQRVRSSGLAYSPRSSCANTREESPLKKNSSDAPSSRMTRREMLKTTGKTGVLLAASSGLAPFVLSGCSGGGTGGGGKSGDKIKVGILHSLSGTMAISEASLKDVEV